MELIVCGNSVKSSSFFLDKMFDLNIKTLICVTQSVGIKLQRGKSVKKKERSWMKIGGSLKLSGKDMHYKVSHLLILTLSDTELNERDGN